MNSLFTAIIVTSALVACAHGALPSDVKNFTERRSNCEHFAGEVSGEPNQNPERDKEVKDAVEKYCSGTDAQLLALKERYKYNASVLKKLNEYETNIEAASK
jgi:hypothetical protein